MPNLKSRVEALERTTQPATIIEIVEVYIQPPKNWETAVWDPEHGYRVDREVFERPLSERKALTSFTQPVSCTESDPISSAPDRN